MGNLNRCLCTTLFLLILFITHTASSFSSSQEIQPPNPSTTPTTNLAHYHQLFYLKNKDYTMFVTRQERAKKRKIHRNNNKKLKHYKKKKKMFKNLHHQSRPFSVMLPKGFVPPSGSSPCHNDQPNSVSSSFHCHLSTSAQP